MKKRIPALLLALAMLLSMVVVPVAAETTENAENALSFSVVSFTENHDGSIKEGAQLSEITAGQKFALKVTLTNTQNDAFSVGAVSLNIQYNKSAIDTTTTDNRGTEVGPGIKGDFSTIEANAIDGVVTIGAMESNGVNVTGKGSAYDSAVVGYVLFQAKTNVEKGSLEFRLVEGAGESKNKVVSSDTSTTTPMPGVSFDNVSVTVPVDGTDPVLDYAVIYSKNADGTLTEIGRSGTSVAVIKVNGTDDQVFYLKAFSKQGTDITGQATWQLNENFPQTAETLNAEANPVELTIEAKTLIGSNQFVDVTYGGITKQIPIRTVKTNVKPDKVEITPDKTTIEIPGTGADAATQQFTATVKDQFGENYSGIGTYTWSVTKKNSTEALTGVTIDEKTGVLTVTNEAAEYEGDYTVKCVFTFSGNQTVEGSTTVTVKKAAQVFTSLSLIGPDGAWPALPGVGETTTGNISSVLLEDQYGEIIQGPTAEPKDFALYLADENGDPTTTKVDARYASFSSRDDKLAPKLTLTNEKLADGSLALPANQKYVVVVTVTYDGKTVTGKSRAFQPSKNSKYTVKLKAVDASNTEVATFAIPKTNADEAAKKFYLVIDSITDQYGDSLDASDYTLSDSNGNASLVRFTLNNSNSQTGTDKLSVTEDGNRLCVTVASGLANSYPLSDGAAEQKLTGISGLQVVNGTTTLQDVSFVVPDLTFTQDETFKASDYTASYQKGTDTATTITENTLTLTPPTGDTNDTYTLNLSVVDQYGRDYTTGNVIQSVLIQKPFVTIDQNALGVEKNSSNSAYTFTLDKNSDGKQTVITIPGMNGDLKLTIRAAKMQFVKKDGSTYTIDDRLNASWDDSLNERWVEYDSQTWGYRMPKLEKKTPVYIKGEKTPIADGLRIVVSRIAPESEKDGEVVYDSSKSEGTKANAGKYLVKLIYTEAENQEHEVCRDELVVRKKTVTVSLKSGETITKVYDGTTSLPTDIKNKLQLNGVFDGEYFKPTIDIVTGSYADANADEGKNIEFKSITLTDNYEHTRDNYEVTLPTTITGEITAKPVTVTVRATKEWDGTDGDCTYHGTQVKGVLDQDNGTGKVSAKLKGALSFTSANVGARLNVSKDNIELTGSAAGNYKIADENGVTVEGSITKATLTITRKDNTKTPESVAYGDSLDEVLKLSNYTITNGDGTEINANAFGANAKFSLSRPANASGHYDATDYRLLLPESQNYNDYKGLDFRITRKLITLTANGAITKVYDGTTALPDNADLNMSGSGAYGEVLTIDKSMLEYVRKDKGDNIRIQFKAGTDNCLKIGDAVASNYNPVISGLTGKIEPKDISGATVTLEADSFTYNGAAQSPKITSVTIGSLALGAGDYTSSSGILLATDVGNYTLEVNGQGNFTGTAEKTWSITKNNDSPFKDRTVPEQNVTRGKEITFSVSTGYKLLGETPTVSVAENEAYVDGAPTVTINSNGYPQITVKAKGDKEVTGKTIKLTLSVPGTNNHAGGSVTIYINITDKLTQDNFKIDQGDSGTFSYAQGSIQLTASGSASGSTISWESSETDVATVDGGNVTILKPGVTIIRAKASETGDYAEKTVEYRLTVTKGELTITASSATMTAGESLPGLTASVSGLNPKDSVSDVFQTLTATAGTDGKTAGTYATTATAAFKSGSKDWNDYYKLSFVNGTLTVNPATSIIDTVLPGIIMGNTCSNGYANCACEIFYDLDASRWYHEAVDWAYNLGLMNGTGKSTFSPNAAASRAQTWTMLARIAGQDTGRSSTWYEVGQKWATAQGITDGTNPLGTLTREQLAAMLYRYVGSPAVSGSLSFADSASVSSWAENAMLWAVQNGILDGVGNNRLSPKGTTTRAQAAAIFMRFNKLIGK